MDRRLLTLFAETPVHAGGPESLAAVDLPIQREAATRLPVIWGQSLKGALREAARDRGWDQARETEVFGSRPPGADGGGQLVKGGIAVGDAQLLALPCPALHGMFAWATAGLPLNRLARKLDVLGAPVGAVVDPGPLADHGIGADGWSGDQVLGSIIETIEVVPAAGTIGRIVGELVCPARTVFEFTRRKFDTDLLVLPDATLNALANTGTDIVARVQLDEHKTVANGPFYAEQLPSETVLAALLAGPAAQLDQLTELLDNRVLQLGGDETIGKGLLWCRVHDAASVTKLLSDTNSDAMVAAPTAAPVAGRPPSASPRPTASRRLGPSPAAMPGRRG